MGGISIISNTIQQTKREMERRQKKALEAVGIIVERHAKKNAPIREGTLRNSITHKINEGGKTVAIGSPMVYAAYQEFGGFAHDRGRSPYLRPAVTENLDEIGSKIKEIMDNG